MNDQEFRLNSWDQYPWLIERQELIKKKAERIKQGYYELDDFGYRKVSRKAPIDEVLKYATVARNQPEIWEMINGIVARAQLDPETEITNDENVFMSFFREWYLLKLDLPISKSAFMVVDRLLLKMAHGFLPDDLESKEVRDFLLDPNSVAQN